MSNYRLSRRKNSDCFVETSRVTSYPFHNHEYYEIELVEGKGCHNVVDGNDLVVNGAMCFLYMTYTRHYYYSEPEGGADICKIGFSETFVPKDFINLIVADTSPVILTLDDRQLTFLKKICTEISALYFSERDDIFLELTLKALLGRLITAIYELKESLPALPEPVLDDSLSRVISYIQANFTKSISLALLSEVAGMSTGYLSRTFHSLTGMTYTRYIISLRMNYAMSLLKMTNYPLKKISLETGYYSESGFIKTFTKYFGFHPNAFRSVRKTNSKKEATVMNTSYHADRSPVPLPKKFTVTGEPFPLTPAIHAPSSCRRQAQVLQAYLNRFFGVSFALTEEAEQTGIFFEPDLSLKGEQYRVLSADGSVFVRASTPVGFSHGGAVILQMAEKAEKKGGLVIDSFELYDYPDLDWRAFMADLARGNYPMSEIFAFADLCYYYRLNVLHLHFADDPVPSWYKLPSPHFPKLDQGQTYPMEEIEILRAYLSDRGITILPEIEMPAHCLPLVANYPERFGGAHSGMVCPGHEGVFEALNELIGDVCTLFPEAPCLHIGCDEARYTDWDNCRACTTFMKERNIPSSAALYTYMVERCTKMVLAYGKTPVVWEGFPKEGSEKIPRETIVMIFQSTYQNARELTESGFRVVNTSWQPLYIVPSRPKYWKGEDIYRWKYNRWLYEDAVDGSDPIDVEDTEKVLGAELCLWEGSRFANDGSLVEGNLSVLAERLWNTQRRVEYEDFEKYRSDVSVRLNHMIDKRKKGYK